MILIDDGAGSQNLLRYPPLDTLGVLARLPSPPHSDTRADASFTGRGPSNRSVEIGIETKLIDEFCTSLSTGRLQATQLPGLLELYDVRWLCIIGEWRRDCETGKLQSRKKWKGRHHWFDCIGQSGNPVPYSYMSRFLSGPAFTQFKDDLGDGVHIWFARDYEECAAWLGDLYLLWQEPYESHSSMRVLDRSGNAEGLSEKTICRRITKQIAKQRLTGLTDPEMRDPDFRQRVRVAASLPSISYHRAVALASRFASPQELINPACTCRNGLSLGELAEREHREDEIWSSVKVGNRRLGSIGREIGQAVRGSKRKKRQ